MAKPSAMTASANQEALKLQEPGQPRGAGDGGLVAASAGGLQFQGFPPWHLTSEERR